MGFLRNIYFSFRVFIRLNSNGFNTTSWIAKNNIYFESDKEFAIGEKDE